MKEINLRMGINQLKKKQILELIDTVVQEKFPSFSKEEDKH